MNSQAHRRGMEAQGVRRRPMQAWVSCSGGRTTACDPHALGGDQCGEQRGPTLSTVQHGLEAAGHTAAVVNKRQHCCVCLVCLTLHLTLLFSACHRKEQRQMLVYRTGPVSEDKHFSALRLATNTEDWLLDSDEGMEQRGQ